MPAMYTRLFDETVRGRVESEGSSIWTTKRGDLLVTKEDALIVQEAFNMETVVQAITDTIPVLLLHGEDDEVIPVQDALALKAARESTTLKICPGARHAFSGKVATRFLIKTVTDWVAERLSSSL
jgi:alpha-beta hydrolase superfamily lysophospholipase